MAKRLENRKRALVLVETAGSVCWFAMDASWMLGGRTVALVLALPTIVLGLLLYRFVPRNWPSWLVTGAMASWACMNVLWMAHDFRLASWAHVAAKVFLILGAVMIGISLVVARGETLDTLATHVRRLRLRA
ncbi:MAG: hypothetical protein K0S65_5023 [Labilithrix sp.]|nr:hypothetical protein [Labilithrix sp.]